MPTMESGVARYDTSDPEDVQVLVNTGFIWKGGPKTTSRVLMLITGGQVTRVPEKEPPNIRAYLDKVAPVEELPDQPEEVEPVEEPDEVEDEELPLE